VIRAGSVTPLTQSWTGDLANPEYVGFADTARNRSLVVIHHENDSGIDSCCPDAEQHDRVRLRP
jgi:hypothetical protein